MTDTVNLGLPCIEAAQAQKHVTHNEALRLLDTLVQLSVLDRDLNAPPGSPAEGERWIVKASPAPTGAWVGHGNHIAAWQDGAWQFSVPKIGWAAFVIDEGTLLTWTGSAWGDFFATVTTLQNLVRLGVGTTADATNPFSVKLNNALWVARAVAEGGDGNLRYKLSKESAAKTLSLLLQTNFEGRAEIGLTGDDDLHVKVSADGAVWLDAAVIEKSTGKLTLGQGFANPTATRSQLCAAPFDALAYNGIQINGGMEVSQESGASSVTLTATSSLQSKYLVDGVTAAYRGTFVAAGQQVADAPPGYRNSLKVTVSAAQSSLGSNDELSVLLPVEGVRAARLALGGASAATISFGFWVKAHRTGAYSGSLRNGAKNRSYAFTFTVNAASTWEFKTVSVAGDTSGTWLTDTGVGLYLNFCIAGGSARVGPAGTWAGSDYSGATSTTNGVAATSDVFQLTGLVMLPGIELPPPDRAVLVMRPFDQELLFCKRYWQKSYDYGTAPGTATSAGHVRGAWATAGSGIGSIGAALSPEMRATPSATIYDLAGNSGKLTKSDFVGNDSDNQTLDAAWTSTKIIGVQIFNVSCAGIKWHYAASARMT